MAASRRIPIQAPIVGVLLLLAAFSVYRWRVDQRGDPDHLIVSGTVEGDTVAVGSRVGGRLEELFVREGDAVRAGQPVARFDAAELQAQREQLLAGIAVNEAQRAKLVAGPRNVELAQAAAAVATARAQLAELQAGSRSEDIAAAEANWRAAETHYDNAQTELLRAQQLFDAHVIPQSQLDTTRTRAEAARAAADIAREQFEKAQAGPRQSQLEIAERQVQQAQAAYEVVAAGARPEDIAAAEAQVESAAAQLAALDVRLDEMLIEAPRDGTVLTVNFRAGDLLQPNQPVMDMLLTDSYYVQLFIPEDKLSWALPGTIAQVKVDAYPGRAFSGEVIFLSTQGEYTPRNLQTKEKRVEQTFRCKLRLQDKELLRPGMVCDVVFDRPDSDE